MAFVAKKGVKAKTLFKIRAPIKRPPRKGLRAARKRRNRVFQGALNKKRDKNRKKRSEGPPKETEWKAAPQEDQD